MTERLFDANAYLKEFEATVLSCRSVKSGFDIVLDKTAFFPEGGGQSSDTGKIGEAAVLDVREENGEIIHRTDAELCAGEICGCVIDWDKRYRKMQNHSGEHIVSGIAHKLFKCTNVGFHLGSDEITVDFDKKLEKSDIDRIERLANEAVYKNAKITASFPSPERLKKMRYRSKLDLEENVRIVSIAGVDRCACCAPHVKRTGEIGIIRLTGFHNYKGGVRINLLCGFDALEDCIFKSESVRAISNMLSVKQDSVADGVSRLLDECAGLRGEIAAAKDALLESASAGLERTAGNICVFADGLDAGRLRTLANRGKELCGGICAVFASCGDGMSYIIAGSSTDLRAASKEINSALCGRGGGSPEMIQGSASVDKETARAFVLGFKK